MITEEGGTLPLIRMEEEEEDGWSEPIRKQILGFNREVEPKQETETPKTPFVAEAYSQLLKDLAAERRMILENEKLTAKQKQELLDENRKTLVVANGGKVTKTDSVVYGILIFGGLVMIILALLTTFAGLPSEVTLSFVGTVLGGTIATIAQKLGKL